MIDPFCGSGTTLLSAKRFGRRWAGADETLTQLRWQTSEYRRFYYERIASSTPLFRGKSSLHPSGSRIVPHLPSDTDVTYIETHAGMLGVLLSRKPCNVEIVNDLNDRIVNFWECVRDRRDELKDAVRFTPRARTEFNRCKATLDEGDAVERARKLYVVISMSMYHGDGNSGGFGMVYNASRYRRLTFAERLDALSLRMETVTVDCRPAVDLLDRVKDLSHTVIYVDPPFPSVRANYTYGKVQHDSMELADVLRVQKGRVAISGYADEWDCLGWDHVQFDTYTSQCKRTASG